MSEVERLREIANKLLCELDKAETRYLKDMCMDIPLLRAEKDKRIDDFRNQLNENTHD